MANKKSTRICAAAIAIVLCVGAISGIVFMYKDSAETNDTYINAADMPKSENAGSFEQSRADNLKFKIGELWRLSLNSKLEEWVKAAIQKINSGFDTDKVLLATENSEDDFEAVADEYLAALQLDLDFDKYLNDRDTYEKEKYEADYSKELLTCEKIDGYLNQLNTEKASMQVEEALKRNAPSATAPEAEAPAAPNARSVLPENPAERIKSETDNIIDNTFGN